MPFTNDETDSPQVDESESDQKNSTGSFSDAYQTKDKVETKAVRKTDYTGVVDPRSVGGVSGLWSEYSECSEHSIDSVVLRTRFFSSDEYDDDAFESASRRESQSVNLSSSLDIAEPCNYASQLGDNMDGNIQQQLRTENWRHVQTENRQSRPRVRRQFSHPQSRSLSVGYKRARSLVPRVVPRLCVSRSRIDPIIPEPEVDRGEEEEEERAEWVYVPLGFWSLPRRDKLVLVSLGTIDLTLYMCLSILAPFYPGEAASRGVSGTVSGWVFGCFALTQFIFSPLFGYILPKLGSRFMVLAGHFLAGGCTVLFGFLDYIPYDDNGVMFVAFSFIVRIFLAIGCTASATAGFAIMVDVFPDNVATVFGLLETFSGVGLMVGPALGGVLYAAGGFMLPFVSLGVVMVLSVPVNMCILPSQEVDDSAPLRSGSLWQIMCIPAVMVVGVATVIGALIWAILDPTLAPHLDVYSMSPSMIGLIFLLMSAFYAMSSPLWGWIADKVEDSTPLMVLGFLFSGLGLLLLGPSTLIGFVPGYRHLWLDLVALVILGMAVSLSVVPTFEKILDAAEKAGVEDNVAMYSHVAGMWGGAYALGDFIGPSVGGFLVDTIGFDWCMTFTSAPCFLIAVILLILWIYEKKVGPTPCLIRVDSTPKMKSTPPERRPLLGDATRLHGSSHQPPGGRTQYNATGDLTRSLDVPNSEQFPEYEPITQSV